MNRRDFLKGSAAAAAFGAMECLGIGKLLGDAGKPVKEEKRMQSSERQKNRQDALAEARKQVENGLILGGVFATLEQEPAAFGLQDINPKKAMTTDSRFDIASVGKVFTASCCARLIAAGKLDPDAPFTKYLPNHVLGKNCEITVRDLATHTGGFPNARHYGEKNPDDFYRDLMAQKPVRPRGAAFEYSCYGFILLGLILNKITGKDLDTLAKEILWGPLGMTRTTWNAPGPGPHEVRHWFPERPAGEHNDAMCYRAKIPLGSGSVFSTSGDMMKFVRDMVERKHFPAAYYDLLTTCCWEGPTLPSNPAKYSRRSFGWDMCDLRRPKTFSKQAIFHSGWTGQTLAIDPAQGFGAMILTSRKGDWEQANQARVKLIDILYRK